MMGILGIFVPVDGTEASEKKLAYVGIQELLENVAMGIEEKETEMREMDLSLSAKKAELIELEKTIRRRQKLLDLTSRVIRHNQAGGRKKNNGRKKGPGRRTNQLHDGSRRAGDSDCREGRRTRTTDHGGVHPLRTAGSAGLGRRDQHTGCHNQGMDDKTPQ
jgi:hypothetical protein